MQEKQRLQRQEQLIRAMEKRIKSLETQVIKMQALEKLLQDHTGISAGVWDDLRFPSQGINPPGAAADPDLETTTGLWLFSATATETLAGVAQLPHAWKESTYLKPHVHWQKTTSAAGNVLWQLDYDVVNNGDVAPMTYSSQLQASSAVAGTPDDNTANRALISSFGELYMSEKLISCLIFWKLSRIGGDASDTYGADARLLEFDMHYLHDAGGSIHEFKKVPE